MLDEQIRLANLADAKLQEVKRQQYKAMAEEDRKSKMLQKLLIDAKDQGKPAEEVISYVYDTKGLTSPQRDSRRSEMKK